MKRLFMLAFGILLAATIVACQQNTTNLEPFQKAIGTVELTFDLANKTTNAAFTPSRSSTRAVLNPQNGVAFSSSSFQVITSGGNNFLNAKFNVSNTSGSTLTDLTLVAYQKSGNTASTALNNLQNFQGLSNAALDTYAASAKPTNGMTNATTVNTNLADLQLFTETEMSSLTTDAATELQAGEYLFPYGFIARATGSTTSRAVANGSNTGSVTVGLKVPNSNEPSSAVYRFSMTFLVFTTPVPTRVAESLEEQTSSGAETRGNASGFNTTQTVALLGSSLLQTNDKLVNACQVRTAGTAASPTAFLATAPSTTAASFDQCFAAGGKRQININTTNLTNGSERITSMAIQPDQKIVLVGWTTLTGNGSDFLVMRLNPDGSFDRTFGTGGKASFNVAGGTGIEEASAVVLQSDGKIVLGGCVFCGNLSGTSSDLAVIRVNSDGTQDTGFNGTGKFTADGSYNNYDQVTGLALQTIGATTYIVAAGVANNGGIDRNGILFRLTVTGGTLDTSFGTSGYTRFSFAGSSGTPLSGTFDDSVNGVAIDANNKILIVGKDFDNVSTHRHGVIRFTANGAWDMKAITSLTAGDATGLLLNSTGTQVVVCAYAPQTTTNDFLAMRFNLPTTSTDGTLDTTFGTSGKAFLTPSANSDTVRSCTSDSSGRIILVGNARVAAGGVSAGDATIARLNANGSADTTFDTDGILVTARGSGLVDEALSVKTNSAGKIVMAGYQRITTTPVQEDDMFVQQINP